MSEAEGAAGVPDVDWQERIMTGVSPELLVEHVLRYQSARPLIAASSSWVDLGTGAGLAASMAVPQPPPTTVLADIAEEALEEARRRFTDAVETRVVDLCDAEHLEQLGNRIRELPEPVTVTAFEVVEHLADHVPLLDVLIQVVRDRDVTVVLSVPDDAFSGVENPYHLVRWGHASFAELIDVLPDARSIARQVALGGSALTVEGADGGPDVALSPSVHVDPGLAASHHIVAFGPRHAMLVAGAAVSAVDNIGHRVWERQREADLAFYQDKAAEVPDLVAYIRDLEARITGAPVPSARHEVG
jgi:hypothetical protein